MLNVNLVLDKDYIRNLLWLWAQGCSLPHCKMPMLTECNWELGHVEIASDLRPWAIELSGYLGSRLLFYSL